MKKQKNGEPPINLPELLKTRSMKEAPLITLTGTPLLHMESAKQLKNRNQMNKKEPLPINKEVVNNLQESNNIRRKVMKKNNFLIEVQIGFGLYFIHFSFTFCQLN